MFLFRSSKSWRHTDRVVHVRFRVVDDACVRGSDQVHLCFVDVDAVDEEGFLAGDAHLVQPVDGRHAILFERVFPVGEIFRHMDVTSNARILRNADTFLEGFIGEGEGGVQSHHGRDLPVTLADLLDEALVLLDAAAHHVAVRDFITQRGADACLADSIFDQVERAIAHAGRGMVVDDRGRAVADAFDQRDLRRKRDIFLAKARSTFHHRRSRISTKLEAGSPGIAMPRAIVE